MCCIFSHFTPFHFPFPNSGQQSSILFVYKVTFLSFSSGVDQLLLLIFMTLFSVLTKIYLQDMLGLVCCLNKQTHNFFRLAFCLSPHPKMMLLWNPNVDKWQVPFHFSSNTNILQILKKDLCFPPSCNLACAGSYTGEKVTLYISNWWKNVLCFTLACLFIFSALALIF